MGLRRYGMAFEGTAILCAEFAQGVLAMQQLEQLMASGQEAAVLTRIQAFKMALSVFGVAVVDAEKETYTRTNTPVSGLDKLLDLLKQDVAGAFHRPQSGIWGNATGTLAGAEEDHKTWAEFVHGWQIRSVIPQLTRYTDLLLAGKDGPTGGKPAAAWAITPNPIDPPDLDAEIKRRYMQAQIDQIYFLIDALEGSETRESRFGGAEYSHETTLDPKITARKAKAAAEAEDEGGDDGGETEEGDDNDTGTGDDTGAAAGTGA
jgi:phage-related protein (TIGR01555 family)